ncbi:MAG: hypothetical protein WD232_05895 [Acidimicrobiales bacterium]
MAARFFQVVALALTVVAFLVLAGQPLDVGTEPGDTAAAGSVQQVGPGTTAPEDTSASDTTTTSTTQPGLQGAGPRPGGTPEDGVTLVDQTDWLEQGEPFDIWVSVGRDVDPDDALVIDLHAPVTSRSQFTETLAGRLLGARRAEFVIPIAELPDGPVGSSHVRLTPERTDAPGERLLRPLPRAGVYPLVVSLRPAEADDDPPDPFTTYLVRTPSDRTVPLRVAVVQPFRSDLAIQPDGDVDISAPELDRLQGIAVVLATTTDTPMTLTLRPETLEALRILSTAGDGRRSAQAQSILDAVADATEDRQVVSGPFVDVTLDALVSAGLGDEIAAQRRRGDGAVEEAVGASTDARTWVEDDGASPRALRRLAALGIDRVVLPDDALSPVDLRLSLSRPFAITSGDEGFELEAASPEPALSTRFGADDPVLGAQHLLADLAVLHGDEPGPLRPRGIVVAPPKDVATDPKLLLNVLEGLAGSPVLEPVTLEDYFTQVEPEGGDDDPLVREVTATGGQLGITGRDVEDVRARLRGFAAVVGADEASSPRLNDLTLLAQADQLTLGERRRYLAAVDERIGGRLGTVTVVNRASFRLPDSEGTIPLTIVRGAGDPLFVKVVLESDKLEFDDATSEANSRVAYDVELSSDNTPLVVPVRVRSPGTFPLLITITSPDGRLELVRSQVTIHSTAFSGVGVALSAGAGLFLLLWWARHWRTVRRAKRLVPVA